MPPAEVFPVFLLSIIVVLLLVVLLVALPVSILLKSWDALTSLKDPAAAVGLLSLLAVIGTGLGILASHHLMYVAVKEGELEIHVPDYLVAALVGVSKSYVITRGDIAQVSIVDWKQQECFKPVLRVGSSGGQA